MNAKEIREYLKRLDQRDANNFRFVQPEKVVPHIKHIDADTLVEFERRTPVCEFETSKRFIRVDGTLTHVRAEVYDAIQDANKRYIIATKET
jgi:hypothetical protein